MSAQEKVPFLADKIEPHKVERRPALEEVHDLAVTDLDEAMRLVLDLNLAEAIERGWHLHPRTILARNELLR
jgi:HD superfamily phosphohydrolase YqeK